MRKKILFPDYLLFAALIVSFLLQLTRFDDSSTLPLTTISSKNPDDQPAINDSMPYSRYRLILDSLQQIKDCSAEQLKSIGSWGVITFPGFTKINEANICDGFPGGAVPDQYKYFLVLPGYRLQPGTDFYMKSGKYFLKTYVPDTNTRNAFTGHFADKEITIRFRKPQESQPGYVLVPITEQKVKTFRIVFYVLAIAFGLYIIWSLIILPTRVLRAIAKDKVITELNIRELAFIGWSLVFFAVLPGLSAFLFDFMYSDSIPDGIDLFFTDMISWNNGLLLAGLIVLLFRRAFKKGYLFRKANELTI